MHPKSFTHRSCVIMEDICWRWFQICQLPTKVWRSTTIDTVAEIFPKRCFVKSSIANHKGLVMSAYHYVSWSKNENMVISHGGLLPADDNEILWPVGEVTVISVWSDDLGQGLYSLSGKTSYCKSSWRLEVARFRFRLFQSLWNSTGPSAAALPRCLSNFIAVR